MSKKKESIETEEREFQLEMLRIQIEHQDIVSLVIMFIAVLFPAMVSLVTTYLNFFFLSGNVAWGLTVMLVLGSFIAAMILTVRYYMRRLNLRTELQKIQEKFIGKKPIENEEPKREKETTKKSGKKNHINAYQVFAVIFTILNIALTGFNVHLFDRNNQIAEQTLEFQNMMYNFTSMLTAKANTGVLETPSDYKTYDNVTMRTIHYGKLDIELQVVTPHYGQVSVTYKYFNLGESSFFDPEKVNQTTVSFAFQGDKYEYLVVSGLNPISDQLDLKAWVYLDPKSISPDTQWLQFIIGRLFLEAELLDIQTNATITEEFSAPIAIQYEPPP